MEYMPAWKFLWGHIGSILSLVRIIRVIPCLRGWCILIIPRGDHLLTADDTGTIG